MAKPETPHNGTPEKPLQSLHQSESLPGNNKQADQKRLEWWAKVARLSADTHVSLEELKTSVELDRKRIDWWKDVASKNSKNNPEAHP
jgi:hypothetical protein